MGSQLRDLFLENRKQVIAMREEIIVEANLLHREVCAEHYQIEIPMEVKRGKGYFVLQVRGRDRSDFPELEIIWGRKKLWRNSEGAWKPRTKPINKGKGHRYSQRAFTNPESWEMEMINRYEDKAAQIRKVSKEIGKISSGMNRLLKYEHVLSEVLRNE